MSRLQEAFKDKKVFIPFITAGDPSLQKTADFIYIMERAGAGIIEVGIPFSDPVAEGPVIQEASIRALRTGVTVDKIFDMLDGIKNQINVPIVLMTYLNPVFHYGYDNFFKKAKEVGVAGIIIPDLPFEEKEEVQTVSSLYGVDLISMIAPTSKERIRTIAEESEGFIYLVSSLGVTGIRREIETDLAAIIREIRASTKTPVAVGFGINTDRKSVV